MMRKRSARINRYSLETLKTFQLDDEPDIILELIEMFFSSAPEKIAFVERFMKTSEFHKVAREVHTLKFSSLTLGADLLSALCNELESLKSAEFELRGHQVLEKIKIEYLEAEIELTAIKAEILKGMSRAA